ncbi:hypothetical protein [Gordonia soli]|uniref:Uncharacterized protein n=1 Tax=Gordonia soli NBRC 108243 TaxID=1223545 RepID=M0QR88_9ACTN|nr:hypothetical protein [Gordonia soli]GAC70806.1 hypothetical protein GS4_41_00530 [Gordonia soli NBRC 108243]
MADDDQGFDDIELARSAVAAASGLEPVPATIQLATAQVHATLAVAKAVQALAAQSAPMVIDQSAPKVTSHLHTPASNQKESLRYGTR